jgi:soluble lytic murein transglycosylase-like protein
VELLSCIVLYSQLNGIDPQITKAVIHVESKGNARAIGSRGEVGLMQVRPEYVPESREQLLDPCTNVKRGAAILKEAMTSCKHKDDNTWLVCYNLGVAGGSRIKFPKKWDYYVKVTGVMK